jgi:3-deoxy-D-manno-octulosonic-acid transferase
MQFVYSLLYAIGFVLLSPTFLYKMWKRGKYREGFWQRFGLYSQKIRAEISRKTVSRCWLQAVSVGEVVAALPLIAELQKKISPLKIILTTTTSTGYALARDRAPKDVTVAYFPLDFRFAVRRAHKLFQPDFQILMESEIWPNHIWHAKRQNVPIFLVNGRLSEKSLRGYRRFGWIFRNVFSQLDLVCAQSPDDAAHFAAVGVPPARIVMTGNMKFDASIAPSPTQTAVNPEKILRAVGVAGSQPVLVAGSTHPGEEEIMFDLLGKLRAKFPMLFLVLVPRHFERTKEVVEIARAKRAKFALRTEVDENSAPKTGAPDCLIVNTTGELRAFYKVATVIFVGKSLVGKGGQNIIEAAASGNPVVFGPNMQNFRAIARQFLAAAAAIQVKNAAELRDAVEKLLADGVKRAKISAAAQRVIAQNVGATARAVEEIAKRLNLAREER